MPAARTLLLAGVPTRLQLDEQLLDAVMDGLGDLPVADAPGELLITDDGESPVVPADEPDEVLGPVGAWRRDGVLFLAWGSVLVARVDDRSLHIARGPSSPTELGRAVRQILPHAVGHLLGTYDRVVLHGGAVVHDEGAVVVLGPTGAGKSTLVYAARVAGRPVLSDDLVAVTLDDHGLGVTGIPRPLAVAADDPEGLPGGARAIGDDLRGRWQFPLEGQGGRHRLVAAVVVEHAPTADGHLHPITAHELWDAVIGSYVSAPDPTRLRAALPALAAVSRLPGWRLGLSNDARARPAVAARLLDGIGVGVRG